MDWQNLDWISVAQEIFIGVHLDAFVISSILCHVIFLGTVYCVVRFFNVFSSLPNDFSQ